MHSRTLPAGCHAAAVETGHVAVRDLLVRATRLVPVSALEGLTGRELQLALIRLGLLRPSLPPACTPIADAPGAAGDPFFWQFPCRTEGTAAAAHEAIGEVPQIDGEYHVYLGLPWATWIDRQWVDPDPVRVHHEVTMQRVRIGGYRRALGELGVGLRVHTVCQHIYWRKMLATWREIGISDAWLSHAPDPHADDAGPALHPWRLFAVNVEDDTRRVGLQIGRDPATKPLLASFIGAHADHYLSDVRLRLGALASEPGFHIETTVGWHFEGVVYGHQVKGEPLDASYRIDDSVEHYNRVLSDSVFSLCPSGAGPNTLRLWESLAVGAVPVLLGPPPRLPEGGTLPPIDWDAIVLRVADGEIARLPEILRALPIEEIRRRQRLGMHAFEQVRAQRCF